MLVLSRKAKQQIQIGEDITVTVVRVKGQAVRVGVEAPDDVRVLRAELPRTNVPPTRPQAARRDRVGPCRAVAGSDVETTAARRYVPAGSCGLP
jgi:carbon storage regulator CsrA